MEMHPCNIPTPQKIRLFSFLTADQESKYDKGPDNTTNLSAAYINFPSFTTLQLSAAINYTTLLVMH